MNEFELLLIDWHQPFWDVEHERRYYDMAYNWLSYANNNLIWIVRHMIIMEHQVK